MIAMKSKTIRVRIAVCVDSDGYWNAAGTRSIDSKNDHCTAVVWSEVGMNAQDRCARRHLVWVDADVPVPDKTPDIEVLGTVTGDPEELEDEDCV